MNEKSLVVSGFDGEVVKAVMRLKQLKGIERVAVENGDRLYSHTNTRGRKRFIQVCDSYNQAKELSELSGGSFFKSWSAWVHLYEK